MKNNKLIWMVIFIFIMGIGYVSATDACGEEVSPNTDCIAYSAVGPGCTTYDVYNQSGQKDVSGGTMTEVAANSGKYKFTFNFNSVGAYNIIFCDNISASLTVKNLTSGSADYPYLNAILSNQVVINDNVLEVNSTVKEMNRTLGATVWTYVTRTITSFGTTTMSSFVEYMENKTETYFLNSNLFPTSWKVNYTVDNAIYNKTYAYDSSNALKNTTTKRIA